jgi:hypothetical protein
MASSQLTFEECKWILKSCWKTENVTDVEKRWRNRFGIWWQTFYLTFVTLNAKCSNSVSAYVSYDHQKCVDIFLTRHNKYAKDEEIYINL